MNDYSFREALAQAYLLKGDQEKADEITNTLLDELTSAAAEGEEGANHHSDHALASVYLVKNKPAKALQHALQEYNRRPKNIDVAELVAWCHYKNGDAAKALPYLQTALRTGSKNPVLLCRAGIIYAKGGDKAKARSFLQDGLKADPAIDPFLKKEAVLVLNEL